MDSEMAKKRNGAGIAGHLNKAVIGFVGDDEMEAAGLKSVDLDLIVYTYSNGGVRPLAYFENKDLPGDVTRGLGSEQTLRYNADLADAAGILAAGYAGGPWQIRRLNKKGAIIIDSLYQDYPEMSLGNGWWWMDLDMLRRLLRKLNDPPWRDVRWQNSRHPDDGWDGGFQTIPILIERDTT